MRITQLTLENFRCARQLRFADDLSLDARANVFFGVNGSGKTTVLDALALLLSWLPARIRSSTGTGRNLTRLDIRNGAGHAAISLTAQSGAANYTWALAKRRAGTPDPSTRTNLSEATELSRKMQETVPVLAYYPVQRAVVDIPLRIRTQHDFSPLNTYENALSSAANFRTFFEWFRQREDIENENLRHGTGSTRDSQLEAVRHAVETILPGYSGLTVRREPLRMEIAKANRILRIDQLSDGEKCLLALVGDLARRLAMANGRQTDNPLDRHGVVLIDEIDLHLHPEWQRIILPRLLDTFPNCQFFITTHSPLVLNQLQPANLFMLSDDGQGLAVHRPSEAYGQSSTRILEDLMGLETTHPDEVAQALRSIFSHIGNRQLDLAQAEIAALRGLGFTGPELTQAETLIRRKELIGR
ncbi:MAG: AAA family ATPase [Oligosphaeraceae bacterium]